MSSEPAGSCGSWRWRGTGSFLAPTPAGSDRGALRTPALSTPTLGRPCPSPTRPTRRRCWPSSCGGRRRSTARPWSWARWPPTGPTPSTAPPWPSTPTPGGAWCSSASRRRWWRRRSCAGWRRCSSRTLRAPRRCRCASCGCWAGGGRGLPVSLASGLVGALTHVVWDLFTHDGAWGPRHIAWLRSTPSVRPGRTPTWAGHAPVTPATSGRAGGPLPAQPHPPSGSLLRWYGVDGDDVATGRPAGARPLLDGAAVGLAAGRSRPRWASPGLPARSSA